MIALTLHTLLPHLAYLLLVLGLTQHVVADDTDGPAFAPAFSKLPADLKTYLSSAAAPTDVVAAIIGDFVTEPDDPDTSGGRHGPAYSEPAAFLAAAQSRFGRFITATRIPEGARSTLASVASHISSEAVADGLVSAGPSTSSASQPPSTTATATTGASLTKGTSTTPSSSPASTPTTTSPASNTTGRSGAVKIIVRDTVLLSGLPLLVFGAAVFL